MEEIISVPIDIKSVPRLQGKLADYKRMLASEAAKSGNSADAICRIFILESLLHSGAANRSYLGQRFVIEFGWGNDQTHFNNAFTSLKKYCENGEG